jgi:hypothetical protein
MVRVLSPPLGKRLRSLFGSGAILGALLGFGAGLRVYWGLSKKARRAT